MKFFMPDFLGLRRLVRIVDRDAERLAGVQRPEKGWIATMRRALGMSAERVGVRKGVTRNAVYQAERSELDGAVSLKQMEAIAHATVGKFVYAIVPDAPIEQLKHKQAVLRAGAMAQQEPNFAGWSKDDQQDWIDDTAAQQVHDMPMDFWDTK